VKQRGTEDQSLLEKKERGTEKRLRNQALSGGISYYMTCTEGKRDRKGNACIGYPGPYHDKTRSTTVEGEGVNNLPKETEREGNAAEENNCEEPGKHISNGEGEVGKKFKETSCHYVPETHPLTEGGGASLLKTIRKKKGGGGWGGIRLNVRVLSSTRKKVNNPTVGGKKES